MIYLFIGILLHVAGVLLIVAAFVIARQKRIEAEIFDALKGVSFRGPR